MAISNGPGLNTPPWASFLPRGEQVKIGMRGTGVPAEVILRGLRSCAVCGVKLTVREKVESIRRYETLLCREHISEREEAQGEP